MFNLCYFFVLLFSLPSSIITSPPSSKQQQPPTTGRNNSNSNYVNHLTKSPLPQQQQIMNNQIDDIIVCDNNNDKNKNYNNPIIGGGSINEKTRSFASSSANNNVLQPAISNNNDNDDDDDFSPSTHLSHLLHSLVGLDRYPQYLSRWNSNRHDIDSLEDALEKTLSQVRLQKEQMLTRQLLANKLVKTTTASSLFHPPQCWDEVRAILDPVASKAILSSAFFRKNNVTVADVLSGKVAVTLDAAFLEEWIDEEMFDVYSIRLLSREFCTRLTDELKRLVDTAENDPLYDELKLGYRPIDLDVVSLSWISDLLFHLVIRPISHHLYANREIFGTLDWRQGYVAGYSGTPSGGQSTTRRRLVSHTDDSEVTLNLCLGRKFVGGNLRFRGLRGDEEEGALVGEFEPQVGTALLHAGRHLHEVTEVEEGDRFALIVWARSWRGIRRVVCPCCWLNRRDGEMCICGKRWN